MQRVNVKIFVKAAGVNGGGIHLPDAIPVFHRWIQQRDLPETAIDVADYSHVPAGPGILLIAHEANYSLDLERGRLGLLYNRKAKAAADDAQGQLRQAYEAAVRACRRLEAEPEFQGRLEFDAGDVELIFNDRLAHPNTDEGWGDVRPEAELFFDRVFGTGGYAMERTVGDKRERLGARVRRARA